VHYGLVWLLWALSAADPLGDFTISLLLSYGGPCTRSLTLPELLLPHNTLHKGRLALSCSFLFIQDLIVQNKIDI